jgi:AraC-like DNA-binding protein
MGAAIKRKTASSDKRRGAFLKDFSFSVKDFANSCVVTIKAGSIARTNICMERFKMKNGRFLMGEARNQPPCDFHQTWESLAAESKFRLKELAELCHVSIRTLQRHFRKNYNLAISQWLRERRLEEARQMLATADRVKTVCFELGYKQQSHFTRDFNQRYGMPPSLWREIYGSARSLPSQAPAFTGDLRQTPIE